MELSSATSLDTSRDQPSAVLKATIRTGSEYCPSSRSVIRVFQIGALLIGLAPSPARATEVVEDQINVEVVRQRWSKGRGVGHTELY
jgi:hypothetical protein